MESWILEAIAKGDLSLNDRMEIVRKAVSARFNHGPGGYCYTSIVFDDFVVIEKDGKLWRVDLTWNGGTVTLTGDPVPGVAFTSFQTEARQAARNLATRAEGQVLHILPDNDGKELKEGEQPAFTGKRWSVLIIQEGLSKNRNNYGRKVLTKAAPKYEGAKIYEDHAETPRRFGRSVKETVGFMKGVRPAVINIEPTSQEADAQAIFALAATAVITKASVRQEMLEAYQEGNPNLFGFSHDAMCRSVTVMDEQQVPFYDVTEIESVASVDLVTNPAAGGRVLRLVANDTVAHSLTEDGNMLKKMIEAIRNSGNADLKAKLEALGATPNEDQVLAIFEAIAKAKPATEAAPATQPTPAGTQPAEQPAATTPKAGAPAQTTEAVAAPAPAPPAGGVKTVQVNEAEWLEVRQTGRKSFLREALATCSIPQESKDQIRKRFEAEFTAGLIPTEAAITGAIKESVDMFAAIAERTGISMPAVGIPRFEVVKGRKDKMVEALDDFFGVRKDDKVKGGYRVAQAHEAKDLMSFRQLYADFTGDRNVTGLLREATRLTEALDTTSFGEILGDSVTRRMLAEYNAGPQAQWRGTIADVVPLSDFRTQRRMRFGGYGNLATVAQGAPYAAMTSPTDEEATYAAAKRGGTEQLTLEMIANDDVGAIRRIPTKIARAAGQTLYEFVFDFMRTNAAIYDATALSHTNHGNASTTALSKTQLEAGRVAMKKQADMSNSKRIGLAARYLWLPTDLEELGFWLTTSDKALPDTTIPGTAASGAPNFQRKVGIIANVVDYWTDTNNWWLTSAVQDTPMIEIGFLGGREEPELFIQDQPNVGSMFSNDVLTYKARHIYGGAVVEYRGFFGGIVA